MSPISLLKMIKNEMHYNQPCHINWTSNVPRKSNFLMVLGLIQKLGLSEVHYISSPHSYITTMPVHDCTCALGHLAGQSDNAFGHRLHAHQKPNMVCVVRAASVREYVKLQADDWAKIGSQTMTGRMGIDVYVWKCLRTVFVSFKTRIHIVPKSL